LYFLFELKPLDKKDLIILDELIKDGRISLSDLAEKIKLSVPATATRVDKLVHNGIIENFTVNIDFSLLVDGKPNLILIKTDLKKAESLANTLYKERFIKKIYFTTGKYNLLLLTHYITDSQKSQLLSVIQSFDEVQDIDVLWLYDDLKAKSELVVDDLKSMKIICDYCKREFSGEIFSKVIGNKKRYFCCNTCLTEFEKRFAKEE